jgi:hypothetical protein
MVHLNFCRNSSRSTNVHLVLIEHASMHVLQHSCAQLSTSFASTFRLLENFDGHGTRRACTRKWLFETDVLAKYRHMVTSTLGACYLMCTMTSCPHYSVDVQ